MRVETILRITSPDGTVVYENTYAQEERSATDTRALLAEYAMLAPNRTKRQLESGLAAYVAWESKQQLTTAESAARPPAVARIAAAPARAKKGGGGKAT